MKAIRLTLSLYLLAMCLLSACQPLVMADTSSAVMYSTRPDAPSYGVRGPYEVGVRDFVFVHEGREVPMSVWYPAVNSDESSVAITYQMDVGDNGLPQFPVLGNAIADAHPDMSSAPYPLLIWSHGAFLYRQTSAYLMEHLASKGFVVVAGNHADNWGTFPSPLVNSYVTRAPEVSAWIDFAEGMTSPTGTLPGIVDMKSVAVGGHSFGGYTALAVAGAQFDPQWYLDEVCVNMDLAEDDPLNDCALMANALDALAEAAGLSAVPGGLWPSWQDPRVDAIFLLAPSSAFGPQGSQTVKVPTIAITGSDDLMQDVDANVYVTYENLGSANKSLVVFEAGGHGMFINDCDSATGMPDVTFDWCSDPVWDMDRAHDLTSHFVTAFLLAELKGDEEAAAALAPRAVTFPGITFQSQGYAP